MTRGTATPASPLLILPPLAGISRSAEVTRRLEQSIELGLLPAGTRLPPETELAEQLGVSAMTLRDALASLRRQGLLVTRRGRGGGSFVQGPRRRRPDADAALRAYTLNDLRDLLDHQRAIAAAIAALAAARAGESDFARLRADHERLREADDAASRRRADARFHVDLAVAAHSTRLTGEEVRFQGELSGLHWLLPAGGPDPDEHLAGHATIVGALVARDPEAARIAAEAQNLTLGEALLERRLSLSS